MLDVSWGDLTDYFGDDPRTRSIILYMESIGDAHRFVSAAREVALTKPIIVTKAGQTGAAAKATGSQRGPVPANQGPGTQLVRLVVEIARQEKD